MLSKRKIYSTMMPMLIGFRRFSQSRYVLPASSFVIVAATCVALGCVSSSDHKRSVTPASTPALVKALHQSQQADAKNNAVLQARLIKINQQLKVLAEKQFSTSALDIQNMQKPLAEIESELQTIDRDAKAPALKAAISESHNDLKAILSHLQMSVDQLRDRLMPEHFLPASKLPFRLVGIDLWNGLAKASIRSNGNTAPPMMVGDSKDGWTLTHLQFSPALARFENAKKQQIEVRL